MSGLNDHTIDDLITQLEAMLPEATRLLWQCPAGWTVGQLRTHLRMIALAETASPKSDLYLIWSHEHQQWWGPNASGYTRRLSLAGRYSKRQALEICYLAMPGAEGLGALPELPVRLDDLESMRATYAAAFPAVDRPKRWE